ncbi:dihydroxy-acid dehydratase [Amorphus coralli]|uniref:dihydroxy-acid dehydratase domain-containing protein n=1 Tax=Amorphus coralli TaxID=340680 RepID=UPI003CCC0540
MALHPFARDGYVTYCLNRLQPEYVTYYRTRTSAFRLHLGRVVGHVAPEAIEGGTIALASERDSITIDAEE